MRNTKPASELRSYIAAASYVLALCVCIAMGPIWTVLLLLIVLGLLLRQYVPLDRSRKEAVRALAARPPIPIEGQWRACHQQALVDTETAVRIWRTLAGYYGVPADRLKCADRLDVELAGLFSYPDTAIVDTLEMRGVNIYTYGELLAACETWGDVVVATHRIETEEGSKIDP